MRTVVSRVARVPTEQRPRVYYARGPAGLETGLARLDQRGDPGLHGRAQRGRRDAKGAWPRCRSSRCCAGTREVIVTIDQTFAATVRDNPLWKSVRAVRDGRVHLSPKLPFGWVDFPPGVNRLMGCGGSAR